MKINTASSSITLFCLPFAGGHKYSYREYSENTPSFIHLVSLEYPGRVARMQDPLLTNMKDLVDDLYLQMADKVSEPYAIYGHSMGGLIAYLLTVKLIENNHKPPLHLFITGTSGPAANSRFSKMRHLLSDDDFLAEMKDLNGIPDAILENDELLSFFKPILRADFQACETYEYKKHRPLNIPMTVITGTEEDMALDDIHLWQTECLQKVEFKQMPGKHFFIFEHSKEIMNIISQRLILYLNKN